LKLALAGSLSAQYPYFREHALNYGLVASVRGLAVMIAPTRIWPEFVCWTQERDRLGSDNIDSVEKLSIPFISHTMRDKNVAREMAARQRLATEADPGPGSHGGVYGRTQVRTGS
jgi:hypothetical protein